MKITVGCPVRSRDLGGRMRVRPICSVEDCSRPHHSHGFCILHLRRWERHGDPQQVGPIEQSRDQESVILRIRTRMVWPPDEDTCSGWTGGRNPKGYPLIYHQGSMRAVSRVLWELTHGPIPAGGLICHSCDNPECVRLDHLFFGRAIDNSRDMSLKGRSLKGRTKESRP